MQSRCNLSGGFKGSKIPMDLIYTINRSKRRSLAIKVTAGEVTVQAPKRCSQATIDAFIKQKENWIRGHLAQQQAHLSALQRRQWVHGEQIYWLGSPLDIQVQTGVGAKSDVVYEPQGSENAKLHVTLGRRVKATPEHQAGKVKSLIIGWLRQQAERWLQDYLAELALTAPTLQVPKTTRIANYKAKWGACSRRGEVSLTWKLWLAPEWVVEYVVQHELAHLTHFNHSPAFWTLVAQVNPDYKDAEQWLRQHGFSVLSEQYLSYAPT